MRWVSNERTQEQGEDGDGPVLVVDEVTVARGVDNVEAQLDIVLLHDCTARVSFVCTCCQARPPGWCSGREGTGTSAGRVRDELCETATMSVVERTGSSGSKRPLVSMRCEAKMVLIRVDLPSPVWPARRAG